MQKLELEYSLELTKSKENNQVVKLQLRNLDWKVKTYYWKKAINKAKQFEYIFGKKNIDYILSLKALTDNFYNVKNIYERKWYKKIK